MIPRNKGEDAKRRSRKLVDGFAFSFVLDRAGAPAFGAESSGALPLAVFGG